MFFNIVFDILIIGLVVAGAIYGIKIGFVSAIARPVKKIATIVLALSLANTVGTAIISPIIGPAISHKVSDVLVEKYSDVVSASADEHLPTLVRVAASMSGIDISETATTADGKLVIEGLASSVTEPVVKILAAAVGFIIVFYVSKILLNLLFAFIDKTAKKGLVGKTNKILGCVFSVLLAVAAAWVFTISVEFLFNIPVLAKAGAIDSFTGGPIYKLFKSISPLEILLSF